MDFKEKFHKYFTEIHGDKSLFPYEEYHIRVSDMYTYGLNKS
jgi:hypothetical protein